MKTADGTWHRCSHMFILYYMVSSFHQLCNYMDINCPAWKTTTATQTEVLGLKNIDCYQHCHSTDSTLVSGLTIDNGYRSGPDSRPITTGGVAVPWTQNNTSYEHEHGGTPNGVEGMVEPGTGIVVGHSVCVHAVCTHICVLYLHFSAWAERSH